MEDKQLFYNATRLEDRATTELIGIAKGLVADGVINVQESIFLVQWLELNNGISTWPFDVINNRVREMLDDGVIDAEERQELFLLLASLIGGKPVAEHVVSFSTSLPLTQPKPTVIIPGSTFCFTGKFAFGQRKDCEKAVTNGGGTCLDKVTKSLDYLVVGLMGNESWMHSAFGRKIQQAIDFNKKDCQIMIVGEDTWTNALCLHD